MTTTWEERQGRIISLRAALVRHALDVEDDFPDVALACRELERLMADLEEDA